MDLFAGMGCFAMALRKFGYNCVYANDNNPYCVQTYEKNHCRGGPGISEVDSRDIATVTFTMSHPSRLLPVADLLTGGFPCPSFSSQGNMEAWDDEENGDHFYDIIKVLIHLQNPRAILENVGTFETVKKFGSSEVIQKEFEAAGYYVSSDIYNAVDFNLAQNRKRCFIVAIRKDLAPGPFECE